MTECEIGFVKFRGGIKTPVGVWNEARPDDFDGNYILLLYWEDYRDEVYAGISNLRIKL